MHYFLCSHFAQTGTFLRDKVAGKTVLFIPTAALHESYRAYVDEARVLWQQLQVKLIELELAHTNANAMSAAFAQADMVYLTGGNPFFLIDQCRETGADCLIRAHVQAGKLYVGESAGAMIGAPNLAYARAMDTPPANFSQNDNGLALFEIYPVPHVGCAPFVQAAQQILDNHAHLPLCPMSNHQALWLHNGQRQMIQM